MTNFQFPIYSTNSPIVLTGKGDDPEWKNAAVLTDFVYPWEKDNPPPTEFRALHDDDWLYCLFNIADTKVYIHKPESSDKHAVIWSSRAEIFFRPDENLDPYYCLEIDPTGRVYDYEARYHRQFNPAWQWPTGELKVKTNQTTEGYTVEVAISKSSLKALNLIRDNRIQAGVFRADCLPKPDNDEPDFKWASWIPPDAFTPDFHVPSAFGVLEIGK